MFLRITNENSTIQETNENKNLFGELNFEISTDINTLIENSTVSINK